MKTGAILTGVIAAVALGGAIVAFSSSASPYVTIAQAKNTGGDRLHLAGDIDHSSVKNDVFKRELRFRITDDAGDQIEVVHKGEMSPNFKEAEKVVVVGKVDGETFRSHQMIVKCPSKYEGELKQG